MWGPFTAYCYRSILDGIEHIAMVKVSTADCMWFQYSKQFHIASYLKQSQGMKNSGHRL